MTEFSKEPRRIKGGLKYIVLTVPLAIVDGIILGNIRVVDPNMLPYIVVATYTTQAALGVLLLKRRAPR